MDLCDQLGDKFTVSDGCWQWIGRRCRKGYGRVSIKRRQKQAHRVIYELLVGPIPEGLELDHLCRNRGCVRPDHLEPVTHRENVRRAALAMPALWGVGNARKTHCSQGHAFSGENLHVVPDGSRKCRTCDRIRARERYHAKAGRSSCVI